MGTEMGLGIAAAILVAASILLVCFRLQQHSHYTEKLFTTFSKLASRHGLSFTSQEKLANGIMGFDGLKRQLLVLEYGRIKYHSYVINLAEVRTCLVQRKHAKSAQLLKNKHAITVPIAELSLHFTFKNGRPPVALLFYRAHKSGTGHLAELEARVKGWHCFLSKLLQPAPCRVP